MGDGILETGIVIPVLLNGEEYSGLVDTGCSHSIVDQDLLPEDPTLPLAQGNFILADSTMTPRLRQSLPALLEYGTRQVQTRFERMKAPHGTRLIIGRDVMPLLGLGITGILPQSLEAEPDIPVTEEKRSCS